MSILYITDQGASLTKSGNRLIVTKGKDVLHQAHAFNIDQIVLMGNISITPSAIAFLLEKGIDTVFMTIYGRYRGRLTSKFGKNIDLRYAQFQKMGQEAVRLNLAKSYVQGKLNNCRFLLRRHNQEFKDEHITKALNQIRMLIRQTADADSTEQLMGMEGRGAAVYFGCFGKLIKVKDIRFEGRNRRPPKDPVNVLLSLGYTLLANVMQTQTDIVGLDPYLGCLHSVEYGRPSLVLDLIEEFRPVLVDTLVLNVINKKIIRLTDFYKPDEKEPAAFDFAEQDLKAADYPILSVHEGMKKFITAFEDRMNQKIMYLPQGKQLSYRDICLEQVRLLARHLKEDGNYAAYMMR